MDQDPTHDQQEWDDLLTAHLLGELSATDRTRFEVLLSASAERADELADLERVAGRLSSWAQPTPEDAFGGPPPAQLDARIDAILPARARHPRRRRLLPYATALVGAAAGVAAVLVVTNVQSEPTEPTGPTVLAVADLRSSPGVRASAGVVDHTWGVEVQFTVSGLPAGTDYEVVVTGDDGRVYDAGAFIGVNRELDCRMNSAVLLADAKSFAVMDPAGRAVVWGDLPDPA
ncbi:hypothetical protein [Williamsia sp. CHRR-6]|uniref:anti-sigma factor n=1 Tax=Williamsia sp. CHRR-6 TaxID=2835871 RepID=UPI001BD963D4|nr:hypothetical protein [Williamsia sp. CHRR-6]MBT0567761.1 hypothetical protein [Williamsia sp. CHRR-6]